MSSLCVLGCASIGGEYVATPVGPETPAGSSNSAWVVRAEEVTALSSRYFAFVLLTFENRSSDFFRIDAVSLDFGDTESNRNLSVPVGIDLEGWEAAALDRMTIQRQEAELAFDTLALISLLVSESSPTGRRSELLALNIAANAPLTLPAAAGLDAQRPSFLAQGVVPPRHLLATPFSVPPGMVTRKWIVLKSGDALAKCTEEMFLSSHFQNGSWQQLRVRFRDGANTRSEWQALACGRRQSRQTPRR